jgi:putative ABC transport system permease protein
MMRLLALEHVENAIQSLKSTRTRTLLTTLGIAIGVASMTAILSLSGGITKVIDQQVDALGGNIAIIQPRAQNNSSQNLANPIAQVGFNTSSLTETDIKSVLSIEKVRSAAPLMIINGSLQAGSTTLPGSTIVATTPALADVSNLVVSDGQFIDTVTNRDTAVVGTQMAIDLFGTEQPIGKTFSIRGQTFTVIGVLKRLNNPVNFNNIDLDRTAIISLESGKAFNQGIAQLQQIDVRATTASALPDVIGQINHKLLENHRNEQDFTTVSGKAISRPTSQLFMAITGVMTAIAAISLIVGGIGVMNIMLVGVTERTREIGLRKSVGASNGNIVWQFMTEALLISLLGGVFGYVSGYIGAFIISNFLPFDPAFTWQIAVAALGTSLGIGVIFGLYPALRAARKDPIESLRQYH